MNGRTIEEEALALPLVRPPDLRKVSLQQFPLALIYREMDSELQELAVAHHRRAPDYWIQRT
jgi:hypothetical protein